MTSNKNNSPADLPQSTNSWFFAIRKLRTWIKEEQQEPVRPYLLMTFDIHSHMILDYQLVEQPTMDGAKDALFATMLNQKIDFATKPQRPAQVFFEDRSLMDALSPALLEIGVRARYRPDSTIMDEITPDLEARMNEGYPQIPGLLSQNKVTRKMVADLFAAAADFFRSSPWIQLSNDDILSIQVTPKKAPYYVHVLGQGGVEYGLTLYKSWQDLELMYQIHDTPDELIPTGGMYSLSFNEITEVPFDDLDAIERYNWEVVDSHAYPVPLIFTPSGAVERPDREEILWYQAALQAIPIFVQNHLDRDQGGTLKETGAEITIQITTGEITVKINSLVNDSYDPRLPTPIYDSGEFEGSSGIPLDHRAIEGDIARILGPLSFHELEPKLVEAQELMYEAWDETNPAKRIVKAYEALNISPDCTDAYVLLADEEADTIQRALEYYQEGVAAGHRALGEDYFNENVGYFWGFLETRPYMRALHGIADCLWKLGQKDAALGNYQELLRLNPNDNQGIRYVLVDLFLSLNREDELDNLIRHYEDDWSTVWLYTRALLAYRKEGSTAEAQESLNNAMEQNPFVPDYLTGKKRIPVHLPDTITMGEKTEALSYAADHLNYWRLTPGAVEWLQNKVSSG